MVRVHGGRRAPSVRAGAARHRQVQQGDQKKKPSYKVVLEEISEQKKLKTFLSFNAEAPPGFTFIPAGDPQLTTRCKQLARDDGSTVYIVSMSDPKNPELSHEVHRVGYHFSSRVVENACLSLGVTLTESGRVLQSSFATLNEDLPTRYGKKLKSKGKGKGRASPPRFDVSQSQATIDTQAREAIRDLFPKIPDPDLHETGRDLVGTSSDLSLARRAHLAVLAHIRHTHTQYDQLLKLMPWADARKRVEGPTLDVLISWRDDVDDDTNVMRDVLREVIIISDNEDEEEQAADLEDRQPMAKSQQQRREMSVEIISVNTNVRTQQLDLAAEPSDLENEQPVQYIPRQYQQSAQRPRDLLREERRGAQRHRRWEQALSRKRNGPPPPPSQIHLVQPVPEPAYQNGMNGMPDGLILQPREPQIPLPSSIHHRYDDPRNSQSHTSRHNLPLQQAEPLPRHSLGSNRNDRVHLINPMRQVYRESRPWRDTAAPRPEYQRTVYHSPHAVMDRPHIPREAQQAPIYISSNGSRISSYQYPREDESVKVLTVGEAHQRLGESQHRRRLSQRILPSVEVDDSDIRDPVVVRNAPALQHQDVALRESAVRAPLQYGTRCVVEPRDERELAHSKRARDEDDVYIISERPRAPVTYEDHGSDVFDGPGAHARGRTARRRGIEPIYDNEPHVVEYNPRIIQLPPKKPDVIATSHPQVQSGQRPILEEVGRPVDFTHRPRPAVLYENRPVAHEQAVRHIPPPESYRVVNVPSYANEYKYTPALQPNVSRLVRKENGSDRNFPMHEEDSSRNVQYYDKQGRALHDGTIPRRESVTYVSSTGRLHNA